MPKNVILTLEYNMGDYSDMEDDGLEIPTEPSQWFESFFQSDIDLSEMKVIGVRIDEGKSDG
jgi:hypothetical protein